MAPIGDPAGHAQLRDGDTIFLCRVAGVAVVDDRVLLHRSVHDDFWALPGGRLEVGETMSEALRREMREEVEVDVEVGRLLWVIENFFDHYPLDQPPDTSLRSAHHELGFYYVMGVPEQLVSTPSFAGGELIGTPAEFPLEFRWFDRRVLCDADLRPAALCDLLSQPLPSGVATVVNLA
jgi:ADP-ribose pyrophosphatase YjhB (NUDIX family)